FSSIEHIVCRDMDEGNALTASCFSKNFRARFINRKSQGLVVLCRINVGIRCTINNKRPLPRRYRRLHRSRVAQVNLLTTCKSKCCFWPPSKSGETSSDLPGLTDDQNLMRTHLRNRKHQRLRAQAARRRIDFRGWWTTNCYWRGTI